jgi:hypothetical protein
MHHYLVPDSRRECPPPGQVVAIWQQADEQPQSSHQSSRVPATTWSGPADLSHLEARCDGWSNSAISEDVRLCMLALQLLLALVRQIFSGTGSAARLQCLSTGM